MTDFRRFPDSFLWGAATAGHQIEGNNVNSDWWIKEHTPGTPIQEPSLDAADSYHRFGEDIKLLAESGLNTYRFSLEWSRIEPEEGYISRAELDHYRRMVDACVENGVEPAITMLHFTVPRWFHLSGGWRDSRAADRFARFVEASLPLLDRSKYAFTINEPNIASMIAGGEKGDQQLIAGALPAPDQEVTDALIASHHRGVELIRSVGVKAGWPVAPQQFYADPGAEDLMREYAYPREIEFLEASRGDDFVGVQAYTRTRITADGPVQAPDSVERTLTGWEYYPPAIAEAVDLAVEVCPGVPIMISENGIATSDDSRRIDYTRDALIEVHKRIEAGAPVIGYLHWSLLDNYEWGSYKPTFGLIGFDRETFERQPKPSLAWLGEVSRANGLEG